MTLVERMTEKMMQDMREKNACPEKELTYPKPEKTWPVLTLTFRPDPADRRDRFLAEDQGLRLTVRKLKDRLWESCYEDMSSGVIIARNHIEANAPDLAQLEAYTSLKASIPGGDWDVNGYRTRLENAKVTFTAPNGDPQ